MNIMQTTIKEANRSSNAFSFLSRQFHGSKGEEKKEKEERAKGGDRVVSQREGRVGRRVRGLTVPYGY